MSDTDIIKDHEETGIGVEAVSQHDEAVSRHDKAVRNLEGLAQDFGTSDLHGQHSYPLIRRSSIRKDMDVSKSDVRIIYTERKGKDETNLNGPWSCCLLLGSLVQFTSCTETSSNDYYYEFTDIWDAGMSFMCL